MTSKSLSGLQNHEVMVRPKASPSENSGSGHEAPPAGTDTRQFLVKATSDTLHPRAHLSHPLHPSTALAKQCKSVEIPSGSNPEEAALC